MGYKGRRGNFPPFPVGGSEGATPPLWGQGVKPLQDAHFVELRTTPTSKGFWSVGGGVRNEIAILL